MQSDAGKRERGIATFRLKRQRTEEYGGSKLDVKGTTTCEIIATSKSPPTIRDQSDIHGILLEFIQLTSRNTGQAKTFSFLSNIVTDRVDASDAWDDGLVSESVPMEANVIRHNQNANIQPNVLHLVASLILHLRIPSSLEEMDSICRTRTIISKSDIAFLLLQWAFKTLQFLYPDFFSSVQSTVVNESHSIYDSKKKSRLHVAKDPILNSSFSTVAMDSQYPDRLSISPKNQTTMVHESRKGSLDSFHSIWETWSTCLDIVIPSPLLTNNFATLDHSQRVAATSSYNHKRLSALLTLSSLNKVIPLTLWRSFQKQHDPDEDDEEIQNKDLQVGTFAAQSFVLLTSWDNYHPTIDFVTTTLLPHLSLLLTQFLKPELPNSSDTFTTTLRHKRGELSLDQWETILSTVRLLQRLKNQGMANPKKMFLTFLASPVLSSFAFLYLLSNLDEETDSDAFIQSKKTILRSIQDVIRDLVWSAFFHPDHHMDGFRSAPNFVVMTLKEPSNPDTTIKKIDSHLHTCYQDQLFQDIDKIVLHDASVKDKDEDNQNDPNIPLYLVSVIPPLLMQGFISNASKVEERQRRNNLIHVDSNMERKNKKISEETIRHQFVFWARLLHPVVEYCRCCIHLEIKPSLSEYLKVIHQCLRLLVESHVYLPSYSDPGDVHYNFLAGIFAVLHGLARKILIEPGITNRDRSLDLPCLQYILSALKLLLTLNHHLLHDQMHEIIKLAASSFYLGMKESYLDLENSSRAFLIATCETYQKLRQLNHLLSSLISRRNHIDKHANNQISPIFLNYQQDLLCALDDRQFLKALSSAIRSSPSAEIDTCWATFYQVCQENIEVSGSHYEDNSIDLSMQMLIIFTQALHIDESNADKSRESCEQAIQLIVWPILKRNGYFDLSCRLTNLSLNLCGWLIDLHTKCCFWINDADTQGLYLGSNNTFDDEIKTRLRSTLEQIENSKTLVQSSHALQHLACHRIQQIHSAIFYHVQDESISRTISNLETDRNRCIVGKKDLTYEANILADFVVSTCCERLQISSDYKIPYRRPMQACWTLVIKHLSSLISYMSQKNVDSFLTWLFCCLAIDADQYTRADDMIIVIPGSFPVPRLVILDEIVAASALLSDVTFFELAPLVQNYVSVGLKVALALLFSGLASEAVIVPDKVVLQAGSFRVHDADLLSVINESHSFDFVSLHEFSSFQTILHDLAKGPTCTESLKLIEDREYITRSMRVVWLIVNMIRNEENKSGLPPLINYLLRLHVCWHILFLQNDTECGSNGFIVDCIIQCRRAIGVILPLMPSFPMDVRLSKTFILYMGGDLTFLKSFTLDYCHENRQLITSGGECIGALTISVITCHSDLDVRWKHIYSGIETIVSGHLSSDKLNVGIALIRPVISRLLMISSNEFPGICTNLLVLCVRDVLKPVCHFLLNCDLNKEVETAVDFSMFVSDTMNLLCRVTMISNESDSIRDDIHELFVWSWKILESCCHNTYTVHERCQVAILYLFGSICHTRLLDQVQSIADVAIKVQYLMVHWYPRNGERALILHAVYVDLVKKSEKEVLVASLSALNAGVTAIPESDDIFLARAAILHSYAFLISQLQSSDNLKIFTDDAAVFIRLAIQQLVTSNRYSSSSMDDGKLKWIECLQTVSSILVSVSKMKALYTFKSTDISQILTYAGSIILDANVSTLSEDEYSTVFLSSCNLCHIFVKQYPKRVYGCCPSLIGAFRALLKSLLNYCSSQCGYSMLHVLHEFSLLCETLVQHKTILKKHIVYLVLDFIRGLDGLAPGNKNKFSTSLFFLMDMLSVHETNQLNALMNEWEKNIFRSLYLQYQINHQYQGQY